VGLTQQGVDQGGFTMVNVGNNGNISNFSHICLANKKPPYNLRCPIIPRFGYFDSVVVYVRIRDG
jgi:hypothetical protein